MILASGAAGHGGVMMELLLICVVAALGMAVGSLKFRGLGLGVAGVLFSGLFFGHLGFGLSSEVASFVREFGLILFVYTIGIQVGPGFFSSLRQRGVVLNGLAASVVLLGAGVAAAGHFLAGLDAGAVAGIFAGATTNTPSLGAAQEALSAAGLATTATQPALAYAVCYPFGILGILLSMVALRVAGRRQIEEEERKFLAEQERTTPPIGTLTLEVTNQNVAGRSLEELPGMAGSGVVISRLRRGTEVRVPRQGEPLQPGDVVLAVGTATALDALRIILGNPVNEDLRAASAAVSVRRIVVTRREAIGKTLQDLGIEPRHQVAFTRLTRADVELPAPTRLRLHAGDILTAVGEEEDLDRAAKELGDSMQDLNLPRVIPIFVGIAAGLLLGSIPIPLPGVPSPVKLGLAGGPLIAAILLSHAGRIGPLVWHLPLNANYLLREIGIVLFLAVVGLNGGGHFLEAVTSGRGLVWLLMGLGVTILPLMVVGLVAQFVLRQNYLTVMGLLAGSTTDPPALAYANSMTKTAAPALAYSTVYPLTMLLRVMSAQVLVLLLSGR